MHMICVCSLKIVDVYMKKAAGLEWSGSFLIALKPCV